MLTKTEKKKTNVLQNRVDCMNRVHEYANYAAPEMLKGLSEGFKLTNDYQFYKKDKERLLAILARIDERCILSGGSTGRRNSSAWLRSDEYNIVLEIHDCYAEKYHSDGSGGYTTGYYKRTVYLWNHKAKETSDSMLYRTYEGCPMEWKPWEFHTLAEMEIAKLRLAQCEKEISELTSEMYTCKSLLGQ